MSNATALDKKSPLRLFTFASPMRFYQLTGALLPWIWAVALGLCAVGLYIGFFVAPTDATQGESYRIIFIHVPAAWMAMFLYLVMAFWAGVGWAFNARLTTTLILLFLYLGYIALVHAIDDVRRGDQAGALLALVGSVNVPIIYFSVKWWNTLHQGATVSFKQAPTMATTMLVAMLLLTFGFWAYAFAVVFMRTRAVVVEREAHTAWVDELVNKRKSGTIRS